MESFLMRSRKARNIIGLVLAITMLTITSAVLYYSDIRAFGEDITISGVNEYHTMKVTTTEGTILSMIFNGASDSITSVNLSFRNSLAGGTTITLTFRDINNNIIGFGETTTGALPTTDVTVNLSNTVTAVERLNLVRVQIT